MVAHIAKYDLGNPLGAANLAGFHFERLLWQFFISTHRQEPEKLMC